ncbi:hypothetical protein ACUSIJ_00340 [Pseudochelatococcus sp. B33]
MNDIPRRSSQAAALLFVMLTCAGCAADGPVHGVAKATGFATDTPEAADFVQATRAEQLDYRPVGVKPPDRGHAPLTAEEIDALKADLDQRRARNESEAATARALGNTPMAQPPVIPPLQ